MGECVCVCASRTRHQALYCAVRPGQAYPWKRGWTSSGCARWRWDEGAVHRFSINHPLFGHVLDSPVTQSSPPLPLIPPPNCRTSTQQNIITRFVFGNFCLFFFFLCKKSSNPPSLQSIPKTERRPFHSTLPLTSSGSFQDHFRLGIPWQHYS